jgi:hypothetical protein
METMTEEFKIDDRYTYNCFIAFLDIMGFKDRVYRERHKDVITMFESFIPAVETVKDASKQKTDRNDTKTNTIPIIFSDSIFLVSKDNSIKSACDIIEDATWIFSKAIKKEIPIKGAIAYGEFTSDIEHSVYFGRPLIDAYELQNELRLYGVIIHHTAEKQLNKMNINGLKMIEDYHFIKYHVPMKSGNIKHYLCDWTIYPQNIEPLNVISKLYNSVSGKPRIYVDNTIDFVREIQKRKAELKQKETKEKPV